MELNHKIPAFHNHDTFAADIQIHAPQLVHIIPASNLASTTAVLKIFADGRVLHFSLKDGKTKNHVKLTISGLSPNVDKIGGGSLDGPEPHIIPGDEEIFDGTFALNVEQNTTTLTLYSPEPVFSGTYTGKVFGEIEGTYNGHWGIYTPGNQVP